MISKLPHGPRRPRRSTGPTRVKHRAHRIARRPASRAARARSPPRSPQTRPGRAQSSRHPPKKKRGKREANPGISASVSVSPTWSCKLREWKASMPPSSPRLSPRLKSGLRTNVISPLSLRGDAHSGVAETRPISATAARLRPAQTGQNGHFEHIWRAGAPKSMTSTPRTARATARGKTIQQQQQHHPDTQAARATARGEQYNNNNTPTRKGA